MNDIFNILNIQSKDELFKNVNDTKPARSFFGEFLYEGELSILFGDSNAGKTILANNIAFFVSGGEKWFDWESPNVPSLYIDMEMTMQQFAERYRNGASYIPDTYNRATVDALNNTPEKVLAAIKLNIVARQNEQNAPKFIVIDNITNGFGSIYSATRMKGFISELKNLKERFGLTIMLIAHCPKRPQGKPITQDNIGGSKMLLNFVDSAFAISNSMLWESARYIKQIKVRHGKRKDKVLQLQIDANPYLRMVPVSWDDESFHFNEYEPTRHLSLSPSREAEIVKLFSEGLDVNEISRRTKIDIPVIADYWVANFA